MNRINVHITNGCNFNCPVCFENKNLDNPNFLDKTKLLSFVSKFKPVHVGFVGGEPLLHPDLPEIIKELRNMHIHTCVVTNGELLNTVTLTPDKFSIGIDNDDQTEVDKFLEINKNNIDDGIFSVEITITPTDVSKIDALIAKYREKGCLVNVSLLAFWDSNPEVKNYINDEYINKMLEISDRDGIGIWGLARPEDIHAFYNEYIPYGKQWECIAPLNIYSDGHLEFCDLENFPTGMTIEDYDLDALVKPEFELKEQCKYCNLRRAT